jgi:hypothetical protein
MKKLGLPEEANRTLEENLQRYLDLFKGSLPDLVIKALVALCGLADDAPICHASA